MEKLKNNFNGLIYMATNKINNKKYIGQTTQTLKKRLIEHKKDYLTKDFIFYRAIRKYGWDSFEWSILEDNIPTLEQLNEREVHWISYYNTYTNSKNSQGYNSTIGGGGSPGAIKSKKTRKKLSERIFSEETRKQMSVSKRGEKTSTAILTDNQVAQIKEKLVNGVSNKQLSEEYDVPIYIIQHIKLVKNWQYVREDLNNELRSMIRHLPNRKEQDKNKNRIINLCLQGYDRQEIIAELDDIPHHTIYKIVEKYEKDNDLIILNKKDVEYAKQREHILELFINESMTQGQISKKLNIKLRTVKHVLTTYRNNLKAV